MGSAYPAVYLKESSIAAKMMIFESMCIWLAFRKSLLAL